MAKIQSVESNIADLANAWMKSYKLDYKLEQESLKVFTLTGFQINVADVYTKITEFFNNLF